MVSSNHGSATLEIPKVSAVPSHVAIIMDGNGRWARKRHLPRVAGHRRGVESIRTIIRSAMERGVKHLTLFAFSSENWRRPADEVSFLMKLFMGTLQREVKPLSDKGVRFRVIGDLTRFDDELNKLIRQSEALTAHNSSINVTVALNYGGRWDIVEAVKRVIAKHPGNPDQITEKELSSELAMHYAPEPDLFIRTGGEKRISNFLLWQLAYSELYFTDTLWPDFDEVAFDQALASYSERERRFGRTSEQLRDGAEGEQVATHTPQRNA